MKIKHTLIALAIAAACGPAFAADHSTSPQGRISRGALVGMWHVSVTLAPCAGGPSHSFIALNTFHTGGTLTSTDNSPPPGNGPAQGIWEYEGNGQYKTHMQFYTFLTDGSGTNTGMADIYQDTTLDPGGQSYTTSIVSDVLRTDGSLIVEMCGTGQGTRVPIDSNPS